MNLVVDDQSPVALVEKGEVRELLAALRPVGEDLVGRDGDRPDVLSLAAILANHLLWHVGLVDELMAPLARGHDGGREDQGVAAQLRHDAHANHGLSSPTGEDDDPAAPAARALSLI